MHLLLHKPYLDATASHTRPAHERSPIPRRGRPPSLARRRTATLLARAANRADREAARRVLA